MANLRKRNQWKSKRRSPALERRIQADAQRAKRGLPPRPRPSQTTGPASRALLPAQRPRPTLHLSLSRGLPPRKRPSTVMPVSRGLPARRPPRQTTSPSPR